MGQVNFKKVVFMSTMITSVFALNSCSKNEKKPVLSEYEKNKSVFDKMDEDLRNQKKTRALFYNSPSWTSGTYAAAPQMNTFYYCGNTASPLGGSYVRFHYQINIDNSTRQDMIFRSRQGIHDRLELRFFSNTFGTSGNDSRVYVSDLSTWPKCVYVDRLASELAIPNYMVAAIVTETGVSTYQLTLSGPYGEPGWNGIVSFPTPPTYAISKGNYIIPHPDGYGVACP